MRFESPLAFALLLLIPIVFWLNRRRRAAALRFSSTEHAAKIKPTLRTRLVQLPLFLRGLVLLLLGIALARPQRGHEKIRDVSQGVAIEMLIDRSGSMAEEMEFDTVQMNRLDAVKKVFGEFVLGNDKTLHGRPNDLIGMITFARYADTVCPLTLGHGALNRFLETVHLVKVRNEDGTAIGDGIALAAARLKTAEDSMVGRGQEKADYTISSKIIILLTDGQNNAGKRNPLEAAKIAKEWGIKIYTIGIGGGAKGGGLNSFFGSRRSGVDEQTLRSIADMTGGIYQAANDASSLIKVYEEIDRLEKSEIESVRFLDYRELFWPFVLGALLLLIVETILQCTVFRKVP